MWNGSDLDGLQASRGNGSALWKINSTLPFEQEDEASEGESAPLLCYASHFFLKNHPYAAAVTTIALAALLCTVEQ